MARGLTHSIVLLASIAAIATAQSKSVNQASKPNELTAAEKAAGWKLLFDGRTLKGWHGLGFNGIPPGLWVVEGGAIKRVENGKGPVQSDGRPLTEMDLVSDSSWHDFELSWEWKIAEAGNSGLKYNVSEELSARMPPPHSAKGWEYQMNDDEKNEDNKIASHRSGALFDMSPRTRGRGSIRPASGTGP